MKIKTMSDLKVGECGFVEKLNAAGGIRRRFRDIGISDGVKIMCTGQSTHRDISSYLIKGAVIAIRRGDAAAVLISQ